MWHFAAVQRHVRQNDLRLAVSLRAGAGFVTVGVSAVVLFGFVTTLGVVVDIGVASADVVVVVAVFGVVYAYYMHIFYGSFLM